MLFTSVTALRLLVLLLARIATFTGILWRQHRSALRICGETQRNGHLQIDVKSLCEAIPATLELSGQTLFNQDNVMALLVKTAVYTNRIYVCDLGPVRTAHSSKYGLHHDDVTEADVHKQMHSLIQAAIHHWEAEKGES